RCVAASVLLDHKLDVHVARGARILRVLEREDRSTRYAPTRLLELLLRTIQFNRVPERRGYFPYDRLKRLAAGRQPGAAADLDELLGSACGKIDCVELERGTPGGLAGDVDAQQEGFLAGYVSQRILL